MAFVANFGNLAVRIGNFGSAHAEPPTNPPDISAAHYALIEKIDAQKNELAKIETAQEEYGYFSQAIGAICVPAEIAESWRKIGGWLLTHAGAAKTELETLEDAERDLLY